MLEGNSIKHLLYFLKKLHTNEAFSLIRPGDGEFAIIEGKSLTTQDKWSFNGGSLQKDLLNAIINMGKSPNGYVGLACKECCGSDTYNYCLNKYMTNKNNLTYANIFCNRNWKTFIEYFKFTKKPIYYIGPGNNKQTELNVIDNIVIDELLVNKWDYVKDEFMKNVFNWIETKIKNGDNAIFCFSAGPIAKILISELNIKYPLVTFLDVGSSFDIFMKGNTNRLYLNDNQFYTKIVCDFEKGHILQEEIKSIELFKDVL